MLNVPNEIRAVWRRSLDDFRREAELEESGVAVESFLIDGRRVAAVCVVGEEQLATFLSRYRIDPRAGKDWKEAKLIDMLEESLRNAQLLVVDVLEGPSGVALALLFVGTTPEAISVLTRWFGIEFRR